MNTSLVERTALSAFTLRGMPIGKGQIVNLDPDELTRLAAAGCVLVDTGANARVPVADLPPFQPASDEGRSIDANLVAKRAEAQAELARLEQTVIDARQRVADDIAGIEASSTERLQALGREVREAEAAAEARKREIADGVEAARIAAEEAISASAAAAKAGKSGNKAS